MILLPELFELVYNLPNLTLLRLKDIDGLDAPFDDTIVDGPFINDMYSKYYPLSSQFKFLEVSQEWDTAIFRLEEATLLFMLRDNMNTTFTKPWIRHMELDMRSYTTAKPTLSFQQFIQRGKVLAMYRKYMRLLNRIPEKKTRKEMREWIRTDFDRYRDESDPQRIDVLLAQANRQLKEMQSSIYSAV
ncbi:hypothetical protein EV175_004714 [Coemansia sp. RSA 1933]|nr:hypothetical protein EV175_004714 [Coemansia sp. RSA 1933]